MRTDAKELHARQVALAQAELAVDPDDNSKVARARRRLQVGVPDMLAPEPTLRPHLRRAVGRGLIVSFVGISLITAGAATALWATNTDVLALVRWAPVQQTTVPSPPPSFAPVTLPSPRFGDLQFGPQRGIDVASIVDQVVANLAAERQADADAQAAAAAAAAAEQAQGAGTSSGSKSSGSTPSGGTPTGGGAVAPAPAPAPAAYVSSLNFHANTGTGTIAVTANVQTSGSMSVSVTCTANGSTIALSGPGTVNGAASYSGSFAGLAAGTYTVKCAAAGVTSSSTTLEVY